MKQRLVLAGGSAIQGAGEAVQIDVAGFDVVGMAGMLAAIKVYSFELKLKCIYRSCREVCNDIVNCL